MNVTRVLTQKPLFILTLLVLIALCLDLGLLYWVNPFPVFFDEFAYLLIGDTISNGRLCNPTHPHYQFFESFQIQHLPCYTGRFPPLLGFVYAIPLALNLHPLLGVIVLHLLAIILTYHVLRNNFSITTTTILSLLVALHPHIIASWVLTYWGGLGSFVGALLTLNTVLNYRKKYHFLYCLLFVVGGLMLLSGRPFEGLVLLFGMLFCLSRLVSTELTKKTIILLFMLTAFTAIIFWGWYNYHTTGSATTSAYSRYQDKYSIAQPFVFSNNNYPNSFAYPEMKEFYLEEAQQAVSRKESLLSYSNFVFKKIGRHFRSYLSIGILLLFLFIFYQRISHPLANFTIGMLVMIIAIGFLPIAFDNSHYSAPYAVILFLGLAILIENILCCRLAQRWKILIITGYFIILTTELVNTVSTTHEYLQSSIFSSKKEVFQPLIDDQRQHLVFVKYQNHELGHEVVYNSANIDQQKIVIARFLNPLENQLLINYYPTRQKWLLIIDHPAKLLEYEQ